MCIYLLFPIWGYCQDSSPGYIVDLNGERSEGLILNGNSLNRYFGCNFRSTTEETFTYYTPDQIKGYGLINGPNFTSVSITLDRTPQKMFVEVKLEGLINIYTFFDRSFIAKSNQQTELIFTPSQAGFNQNLIVQIMQDCDRLSRRLEMQFVNNLDYVMELTRIYNSCSEPEPERTIQLNWHPFMGVDLSFLKIQLEGLIFIPVNGEAILNRNLTSGGFYISAKHKKSKYLNLFTGVWYVGRDFTKSIISTSKTSEFHSNAKSVNIPFYVVFKKAKFESKWNPFGRIGIVIPFVVSSNTYLLTENNFGNTIFVDKSSLSSKIKVPMQMGISVGSEIITLKKYNSFAEIQYHFGKSKLTPGETVTLSGFSVRVGLKY